MASLLSILKNVINLNRVHVEKSEIITVAERHFGEIYEEKRIYIWLRPIRRYQSRCPICGKKCHGYDYRSEEKSWWRASNLNGIPVYLFYFRQRIECAEHGVHAEWIPWADGESRFTESFKVKALKAENNAFKSGEKYLQMQEQRRKDIAYYERKPAELRRELADAHKETITSRNIWMEIVEELEALLTKSRELTRAQAEIIRHEKAEKYAALVALEEEREKNRKLQVQLNRDYSNSSKPSCLTPFYPDV